MRPFAFTIFLSASVAFGQPASPVHSLETDRGTVHYVVEGGFAIAEGDIILGPAAEIEARRIAQESGSAGMEAHSLTIVPTSTSSKLWPNGTIYYTIDADVPNQQFVLDGIAHWNTHTSLKVLPRTNEANYVRFTHINIDAACNSYLGMVGGEQALGVTNNCPTGSVIHELGHAFGLYHEQQRTDRDGYMTVLYENIDKRFVGQFPEAPTALNRGYYDFDSIMHYPATGFSRNFLDSLESVPPGIPIGQRNALSPGDIDGVSRLYGIATSTVVTTTPPGLTITVDGVSAVSPQTYNWTPGTQHTVTVAVTQGIEPRYQFAFWSDGGGLSHDITASAAVTAFSAQFVRQHTFAAGVSSGQGSVSVFPAPVDNYVNERVPLRITATAAPGYQFVRWVGSTALSASGHGVSSNPADVETQNGPTSYQAVFSTAALTTVDSQPRGAVVIVDGGSYFTPANFNWTPGSTHTLNYVATQNYGNNTMRLQFLNWETGSPGARTVTAGQTSTTYLATFNQQFLLTYETSGAGTVTAAPPSADGFYDTGTTVQLTAGPNAGQTLRFWLGDVTGGSVTSSVKMDQQRDATAYFGSALSLRILNAASFLSTPDVGAPNTVVAPGEILAVFGSTFGPVSGLFGDFGADGKMPLTLGGTTVTFDGVPAPLLYVSATQIDAIVPYAVAGKATSLLKIASSTAAISTTVAITATAPALFAYDGSGSGEVAAINEDYTVNSPTNPAAPGSIVVLYATGAGTFDKTFADGVKMGVDLGRPTAPVYVRFGKLAGTVLYAGTAPFLVNGALQVNVRIPAEVIGGGPVPVQLIVGSSGSQLGATISVAAK